MSARLFRFRILCITCLVMLFGALAPSIDTFLDDGSGGKTWVEICTSAGTKRIALDNGDTPERPDHAQDGTHCPWCRLQQELPAIAHAPDVEVLADGTVQAPPPTAVPAPRVLDRPWPAGRSRAPPHLS